MEVRECTSQQIFVNMSSKKLCLRIPLEGAEPTSVTVPDRFLYFEASEGDALSFTRNEGSTPNFLNHCLARTVVCDVANPVRYGIPDGPMVST